MWCLAQAHTGLACVCLCSNLPYLVLQVVVGVLGCPNMPQAAISDDDCDDVASRAFDKNVGMLFAAQRVSEGRLLPWRSV